ncbi:Hsp20 family protein [Candidatus Palibaumannia cicadellinicola]|uniref:Heat shock protein n=1 Tax=Baumannia cicadellinicola subsp. Homalodisca coagulata TaxID=374463 RepID=Q1LU49_BAUCH|nr:Hsp20 family protein [Candidatus Baumannia cicadellinicola]ABF14014.1 heat shock protein [Baumannia cicadellinicola str. Hc (Homalodisca coagulata)]MBS0032580.1 Hsp20 family protein [Candidatus Baumannia cicadellinicola]MCJ7462511.1 Hsp20 family protein [Candidatus Baumannia cicadellinicola]MCJ7462573.1 Hsp20 family protein [Candidatus Baumannia cicadellinicola]
MAYRSLSLIPALSNNLLSDRFTQMDNLFSRLTGEKPLVDTPAYNLIQKDKEHYELTISVPGYTQEELDISVLNNQLTISGKQEQQSSDEHEKTEIKWLHHGITKQSFALSFNLEHRINIQKANLDNGLLILQFNYYIPEEEKPKKIAIKVQKESATLIK